MDTRTILLIEDQPDDVVLTIRALQRHGLKNEIVVVRDGVEALEYLHGKGRYGGRDFSQLPALVLLDLKLPRINGHEFLSRLQSDPDLNTLRVVVLTSSAEDEDIVMSYGRGACSYIRKPLDYQEFVEAVGQLSQYWLVLNEPIRR